MNEFIIDFERVFDQLPVAAVVSDIHQLVIFSNARAKKQLAFPSSEGGVYSLSDVVPTQAALESNWKSLVIPALVNTLSSAQGSDVLVRAHAAEMADGDDNAKPNGRIAWQISHTPLIDRDGSIQGVITVINALDTASAAASVAELQKPSLPVVANAKPAADQAKPVAPDTKTASGHINKSSEKGTQTAATHLSILLVEDNEDLRTSTSELLEFLGHRVVHVPDAEQALRQLHLATFDVLFTDLTLPRMTGAELARQVLQHHRNTSVIITSGYGRAMANAQSLDAVFIPKPYRFSDLEEVLKNLIKR